MNNQKKIEQCLRSAHKSQVPDDLLEKLQTDISANNVKTRQSALRRWFAPTDGLISPWRVAAAVAIAAIVLMPLTYAGGKAIKNYFVQTIVVTESIVTEDGSTTKVNTMSVVVVEPNEQTDGQENEEIEVIEDIVTDDGSITKVSTKSLVAVEPNEQADGKSKK
jgi:hypothetical protein